MGSVRPYSTTKGKRYEARYKKPDGTHGSKRGFSRKRDAEIWLAEVETTRAHRPAGFKGDHRGDWPNVARGEARLDEAFFLCAD